MDGEAQWRARVERSLGGAALETLIARTYDDIAIRPLYAAAEPGPRPLRAKSGPWRVLARLDDPDLDRSLAQARDDLSQGADDLVLVLAEAPCSFGLGLADGSRLTAARFFAEVEPRAGAELYIETGPLAEAEAESWVADWTEAATRSHWTRIRFAFDPATDLAIPDAALRGERAAGCFCADGRRIHAAGGSEAQELAFVLACGTAALRAMQARGLPLAAARQRLSFAMAADADFFLTIAKFRALRLMWSRVEIACGLTPAPIALRAETAWRMMTQRDPWTNGLRVGLAVAGAALGGADAIAALPFTQALGVPDRAARRLARNTQLVLLHEAHLAQVSDPAGGSGGFEALTRELCARAWTLFQDTERAGGLRAALAQGLVQAPIAEARRAHERAIARRLETIVGTSDYPDLGEASLAVLGPAREMVPPYFGLPLVRFAEPFEWLRDRAQARLAARGERPRATLIAIGSARAAADSVAFARALFEAGGFAVDEREMASAGAGEAAPTAPVACLCPAPAILLAAIGEAARALARGAARLVFVCAEPGGDLEALRASGDVADFLHPGCDALAILERALAQD